ncbi:DoxX family membrane protein [Spirosoma sp. KCTC 42546]|uniref:DoxX family protein n=1 Tax=Spirosoma sp. KCTC 42546 TaxID=2520506 RepID=UPI001157EBDB|nr:DoxX family protein [Spirosoma sp. KCTC 42546]QDK82362.1 DoxX family membrane protein [Spirosoma sp. KCTC 42546]
MSVSIRNLVAWILRLLLCLVFLASSIRTLSDLPGAVRLFTTLGLPGWLAYVIGGAELLGSIGLLVPMLTRFAAIGLSIIMIGAIGMHAFLIPGGLMGGIPAMILLLLLTSLLWLRRLHPSEAFDVSREDITTQV